MADVGPIARDQMQFRQRLPIMAFCNIVGSLVCGINDFLLEGCVRAEKRCRLASDKAQRADWQALSNVMRLVLGRRQAISSSHGDEAWYGSGFPRLGAGFLGDVFGDQVIVPIEELRVWRPAAMPRACERPSVSLHLAAHLLTFAGEGPRSRPPSSSRSPCHWRHQ
ncbi:hypothetical protein [Sinorhizobium psoraleae]|uniref:Uncharacterized protein n=1 Tax=Sinorhizobium psoraleae TaxID=520838 RepID=A0ABT4KMG5_9HYPH|nr:hypothetical protein [Sinorhizobium psoraleae]MCZ4093054.1 hypothetical protein [Sinorhizobium psoraleae]